MFCYKYHLWAEVALQNDFGVMFKQLPTLLVVQGFDLACYNPILVGIFQVNSLNHKDELYNFGETDNKVKHKPA
jgi:hypothetical protein